MFIELQINNTNVHKCMCIIPLRITLKSAFDVLRVLHHTYLILFTVMYPYILKMPFDGAKVRRKGVSYNYFLYETYFLLYFHGANELNKKIQENVFARAHKKFEHSRRTEINFTILWHTRRQNETRSNPQSEWPIRTYFSLSINKHLKKFQKIWSKRKKAFFHSCEIKH